MAKKMNKAIDEPIEKNEVIVEEPVKEKKIIGKARVMVNVRKQPVIESAVETVLEKDQEINVIKAEPENGFIKTELGYVMKEYLELKEA